MPGPVPGIHVIAMRDQAADGGGEPGHDALPHFTSWMRLINSANRGPYLSQTGLTAC